MLVRVNLFLVAGAIVGARPARLVPNTVSRKIPMALVEVLLAGFVFHAYAVLRKRVGALRFALRPEEALLALHASLRISRLATNRLSCGRGCRRLG